MLIVVVFLVGSGGNDGMSAGLLRVRAAEQTSNPQVKILEVNKLLKTIINLPHKVMSCTHTCTSD